LEKAIPKHYNKSDLMPYTVNTFAVASDVVKRNERKRYLKQ